MRKLIQIAQEKANLGTEFKQSLEGVEWMATYADPTNQEFIDLYRVVRTNLVNNVPVGIEPKPDETVVTINKDGKTYVYDFAVGI